MVNQPLAERLAGCLLHRLAASALGHPAQGHKQDHSIVGLVSRLAGGKDAFVLEDLLKSAVRWEASGPSLIFQAVQVFRACADSESLYPVFFMHVFAAGRTPACSWAGQFSYSDQELDSWIRLCETMLHEKVKLTPL